MSNNQIDQIINMLKAMKTVSKPQKKNVVSNTLMRKWNNCLQVSDLKQLKISELRLLSNHVGLEEKGEKSMLAKALWKNWEDNCSESEIASDSESESEYDSESESESEDDE